MTEVKTQVSHGCYTEASSFEIVQREYAGAEPPHSAYRELLEIKDPKKGKRGIVIHAWDSQTGSRVYEFETLEQAQLVWRRSWCSMRFDSEMELATGFVKCWNYGHRHPWFYDLIIEITDDEGTP